MRFPLLLAGSLLITVSVVVGAAFLLGFDGSVNEAGQSQQLPDHNARGDCDESTNAECLSEIGDGSNGSTGPTASPSSSSPILVTTTESPTTSTLANATTTQPTTTTTLEMQTDVTSPSTEDPVLHALGFGVADPGDLAETAIDAFVGSFGPPDQDTGWVDGFSVFGTCPSDRARQIRWGDFAVVFGDSDTVTFDGTPWVFPAGSPYLLGADLYLDYQGAYGYPRIPIYGTDLTVGSTVADLAAEFGPRLRTIESDDYGFVQYLFTIDQADMGNWWGIISGTLTGLAASDQIESIHVGGFCGE